MRKWGCHSVTQFSFHDYGHYLGGIKNGQLHIVIQLEVSANYSNGVTVEGGVVWDFDGCPFIRGLPFIRGHLQSDQYGNFHKDLVTDHLIEGGKVISMKSEL